MTVRLLLSLGLAITVCVGESAATGEDEVADGRWSEGFHFTGINSSVSSESALERHADGLYLSRFFTRIGAISANRIARYDGVRWHALGQGLSRTAHDLLSYDGLMIAAGERFVVEGDTTLVAAWDGIKWSSWNYPGTGSMEALAEHKGELYVAGHDRVSRWNGASWDLVGATFTRGPWAGAIHTIASHNGALYAGGLFDAVGGEPVSNVARWNGTAWEDLGGGPNGQVRALMSYENDLLMTGAIDSTNGEHTKGIVRWTGDSWVTIGNGNDFYGMSGRDLFVFQNELYLAGTFRFEDDSPWHHVAKLVNDEWKTVGEAPNATVFHLEEFNGLLYATGHFKRIGTLTFNNIAAWDDTAWAQVSPGLGLDEFVDDIASFDGDVVVVGRFQTAGNVQAYRVARLAGSGWSALGPDEDLFGIGPLAVLSTTDRLYVGGHYFNVSHGNCASVWDGFQWAPMGDGMNGTVRDLIAYETEVVAGGEFTTAGGSPAGGVARWNGTEWSPLGTGIYGEQVVGGVLKFAEYQGELIAGGSFTKPQGGVGNRVAAWNGSSWRQLHTGMDGTVSELVVHAGDLVAGGSFSLAGGDPADRLARWDGQAWHAYEPGLPVAGSVTALVEFRGALVVAVRDHVMLWTEGDWVELGEVDGTVRAFLEAPEGLYAVGPIEQAGENNSNHIALWLPYSSVGSPLLDPDPRTRDSVWIRSSPNPFETASRVFFQTPRNGSVHLGVYDVQGRLVRELVDSTLEGGRHEQIWRGVDDSGRFLPSGVYFLRLETGTDHRSTKVVLLR